MRASRDPNLMKAFGLEVKLRRAELGWTQEDLAGVSEVPRPYLSVLETGEKQPSLTIVLKLSWALGLSFGEFADRVERRFMKVGKA